MEEPGGTKPRREGAALVAQAPAPGPTSPKLLGNTPLSSELLRPPQAQAPSAGCNLAWGGTIPLVSECQLAHWDQPPNRALVSSGSGGRESGLRGDGNNNSDADKDSSTSSSYQLMSVRLIVRRFTALSDLTLKNTPRDGHPSPISQMGK